MLELFWTDAQNKEYHLGNLYKIDDNYFFDIMQDELKQAVKHGCFGIGNIDITKEKQESKELFSFFKNRIPNRNELAEKELIEQYGINEYDEMEILKITEGRMLKDRYYLKYIEDNLNVM